jgi:alkylation response protein AidB-like acyl-CoA dehydrogenase
VTGEPGSLVVNGVKYYSTGSNFADWISVAAKGLDDEYLIVIVDGGAPGVEVLDDWSGFGQRTTGSGTARFTDVALDEIGIFAFSERAPYQEAVYQLVHLATLAGIGRAAHRDVVGALQRRERAFGRGPDDVPSRDTHLQAVVGQVSALASAAEASVSRAASYLDVGAALAIAGEAEEEQVTAAAYQAAIAVYEAQISVTSDVLAATTLLFDALGASALDVSEQLDRHWRNARTICSHNPRVHKERIVGDWYLNGTPPKVFKPEDEKPESDPGKPEPDHVAGGENGAGADPTQGISDPEEQPTQPVAGTPR